jgi:hypothetical protein
MVIILIIKWKANWSVYTKKSLIHIDFLLFKLCQKNFIHFYKFNYFIKENKDWEKQNKYDTMRYEIYQILINIFLAL